MERRNCDLSKGDKCTRNESNIVSTQDKHRTASSLNAETKHRMPHQNKDNENTMCHRSNGVSISNKDTTVHNDRSKDNGNASDVSFSKRLSSTAGADDEEKKETMENDKETEAVRDAVADLHPGLPVDRGWAWVVMIAQFMLTFLMVGYGRALSMFILEFIDIFDVPVTTATTALGLMTASFGFGNVFVSHALLPWLGTRTVVIMGVSINVVGIAVSSLAPSMLFIIITHCFVGFAHALMYVPSVTLLGHYFNTRRSFAMAVANTGVSVSALVFPPFTQYLITSYGARGALLITAGIQFQALVAASLLRPVSFYAKKKMPQPVKDANTAGPKSEKEAEDLKLGNNKSNIVPNCGNQNEYDADFKDITTCLLNDFERPGTEVDLIWQPSQRYPTVISSSVPEKSFWNHEPERYASAEMLNIKNRQNSQLPWRNDSHQQSCPVDQDDLGLHHRLASKAPSRSGAFSASLLDVCGSTVTVATDVLPAVSQNGLQTSADGSAGDERRCHRCWSVIRNIFDFSLFRNWLFRLIIAYSPLGLTAGFITFYFPSLGVGNGLSRPHSALLVSVIGGVDLGSRLSVGYLADLNLVKRTHIVAISMIVLGLVAQFSRFYTSFGLLAMFGVVFGLTGGSCQNLLAVVIIDLLGLPQLGKVMGLVLLFNSACASLTHVLVGALVDVSGSFAIPFNYVGACLIVSALILLLEPLARRLEAKRVQKLERDIDNKESPATV